jgi:hypothetical protein
MGVIAAGADCAGAPVGIPARSWEGYENDTVCIG